MRTTPNIVEYEILEPCKIYRVVNIEVRACRMAHVMNDLWQKNERITENEPFVQKELPHNVVVKYQKRINSQLEKVEFLPELDLLKIIKYAEALVSPCEEEDSVVHKRK